MNVAALDTRNTNALWCSVLVDTLVRKGLTQAVLSPGSRSTPLTIAFARHPGIEAIPVLDERSAGFFALGLAKQHGKPVVLVCTSGTAAANYLPAVVEAFESATPLIVITADRPPEMRACGSGQTIDQQKLFGSYVSFYHEMAVPSLEKTLFEYLRQTLAHAWDRSLSPSPVHLNAPFRDPLPPLPDGGQAASFAAAHLGEAFFSAVGPTAERGPVEVIDPPAGNVHGLIVVGPAHPPDPEGMASCVGEIARRLGWPVLADGLTPLRTHASLVPHLVTTYDAILRNPADAESLKPEFVLAIGGWPTSKVLRSWLEAANPPTWLVSERPDNRDPLHGRTIARHVSLPLFAANVGEAAGPNGYTQLWRRCEERVRAKIDAQIEGEPELIEPKAAWLLARHLPVGTPLFIANSMPIRDVEYVWPAGERRIRPLFNRGANGIDGTLSSALGCVHGGGLPGVLLTGDLAFLHDSNGLLMGPKLRGGLTVVLVNNRGGGIFEHLPVAAFDPPFEEFFATPQDVDFESLCAAHRVPHHVIQGWEDFADRIRVLPPTGIRVLELKTDRKRDSAWRKAFFRSVSG